MAQRIGPFQLKLIDSEWDKYLLARDELRDRLDKLYAYKRSLLMEKIKQMVIENPTLTINQIKKIVLDTEIRPSIADIISTHKFLFHTSFKKYVAFGYEYVKVNNQGAENLSLLDNDEQEVRFNLDSNSGDFWCDQVLHITLAAVGDPNADPEADNLRYRYCNFPGVRIVRNVALEIDKVNIDEYNTSSFEFYNSFRIPADKRAFFNKCIGQEVVKTGYIYYPDQAVTQDLKFRDGPQTAKPYQEKLDLWIPLIFAFNQDVKQSFFSAALDSMQKYIVVKLASLRNIIQITDRNGVPLPTHKLKNLKVENISLYTKNIFLSENIRSLFVNRRMMNLIRVYRTQSVVLDKPNESILLHQLKYPIETLYLGVKPVINESDFVDWCSFAYVKYEQVPVAQIIIDNSMTPNLVLVSKTANFRTYTSPVKSLNLLINTNEVVPLIQSEFYSNYIPLVSSNISSSNKYSQGACMINFNIHPHKFEPSGFLTLAKNKEIYCTINSETISSGTPATLYVSAIALNFLMFDRKKCILRFS